MRIEQLRPGAGWTVTYQRRGVELINTSFVVRVSAALLLLISGCSSEEPSRPELELIEVQRYGVFEAPAIGDRDASEAGVIGAVTGVVRATDSTLLILDQQALRILRFNADGSVRLTIRGGRGDGPGEFRSPIHLTPVGDREVSVLDYDLGRVTYFSLDGEVTDLITLDRTGFLRHIVTGDSIWLTRGGGEGSIRPMAWIYSRSGDSLIPGQDLDPQDQAFGSPIHLARSPDGAIALSSGQPGVWTEVRDGVWRRRGVPLFPDLEPPRRERVSENVIQVTPPEATTAGIGFVGNDVVVQRFWRYTRPFDWEDPPERDEIEHFLAVFRRTGEHIGTIPIIPSTGLETKYLFVDQTTGHIFMTWWEPFPQVVEYDLVIRS